MSMIPGAASFGQGFQSSNNQPTVDGRVEYKPVVTRFFWPPEIPRTMLLPTSVSWQTCTQTDSSCVIEASTPLTRHSCARRHMEIASPSNYAQEVRSGSQQSCLLMSPELLACRQQRHGGVRVAFRRSLQMTMLEPACSKKRQQGRR